VADGKRYSVDIVLNLQTGEVLRGQKDVDRATAQMAANISKSTEAANRSRVSSTDKAEREVQRIREQTRRQGETQERLMERSNKVLNDARVRYARQSANEIIRSLDREKQAADRNALGISVTFKQLFGANFLGSLAARAVGSFISELRQIPAEAARISAETQNAFKGLESIAAFKGIDEQEARRAVQNLRFVRGGIISVGEAATGLKNLLATGFSLPQAITLMERFSDASAFGKQQALSYGDAIRSATEGVKNQNSVLVDNAGITKNLSVILKERGFRLEDLSDKTKGAAARQALYNGLLVESAAQVGDADKVMQSYTGAVAGNDQAYEGLLRQIGDLITRNPVVLKSLELQSNEYRRLTKEIQNADKDQQSFFVTLLKGWELAKVNTINTVEAIGNAFEVVLRGMALFGGSIAGIVTAAVEAQVNAVIRGVNLMLGALDHPAIRALGAVSGVSAIPEGARIPEADLGGAANVQRMRSEIDSITAAYGRLNATIARSATNRRALFAAGGTGGGEMGWDIFDSRTRGRRPPGDTTDTTSPGGGTGRGRKAPAIRDEEDRFNLSEMRQIAEWFKGQTGRMLSYRAGQTPLHNRRGWDHRNAADVHLNPASSEGRLFMDYLRERGIPFTPSTGREPWSTGPHIHVGQRSQRFGANVRSRAVTRSRDEAGLTLVRDAQGQIVLPDVIRREGRPEGATSQLIPADAVARFVNRALDIRARQNAQPVEAGLVGGAGVAGADALFKTDRTTTTYGRAVEEMYDRQMAREQELHDRQRNFIHEIELIRREADNERLERGLEIVADLERAEGRLRNLRSEAADDQLSEQRRLLRVRNEEIELIERLTALQDESVTMGANAGLRQQVVLLEELNALRRADVDAIEDQIRAQVRLGDQTIFHADRANASVLEFLASQRSVTEVIADARIGVIQSTFDFIDRGLDKWTSKLGVIGGLVKDLISGFARIALSQLFAAQGGLGGGQQSGGGFNLGNILGGIFGRSGPGGTPLFNGSAGSGLGFTPSGGASIFRELAGPNIAPPVSASGGGGGQIFSAATQTMRFGDLFRGIGFGMKPGTGGPMAAMLPLLAASAGAQLGGGGIGSVIGGAGGLLAGIGLTAAPTFLAKSFLAPLFSNPFTAIAGGALVVGSLIMRRNAARRRDETLRGQINNDTGAAIWDLIRQAQQGQLGLRDARTAFDEVMRRYDQSISQIRDSKTKRIAIATRSHYTALWPTLERAAREADAVRARDESNRMNMRATYDVPISVLSGTLTGLSGGANIPPAASMPALPPTPSLPTFTAPTPSFSAPAFHAPAAGGSGASGGNLAPIHIAVHNEAVIDDQGMIRIVTTAMEQGAGRRVIIETSESRVRLSALRAPV